MNVRIWFLYRASPQQGDLRISGPPSGRDASGGARIRERMVLADLRADSLATVPPTSPMKARSGQASMAGLDRKIHRNRKIHADPDLILTGSLVIVPYLSPTPSLPPFIFSEAGAEL
ncbi:hypothetical protein PoB_005408200 [Plakobranchus ocellatus]|uniref:Uncharacterized protein n=1 Tax=Plakobranchus ocellatus TaxID=259542 RepID=A0AAV4C879_9GAST|nr:hypothetical protein PoB_005408200 [Plakobranchus ocellatus]